MVLEGSRVQKSTNDGQSFELFTDNVLGMSEHRFNRDRVNMMYFFLFLTLFSSLGLNFHSTPNTAYFFL